ncbi:sulfatase family protein [Rhodopirellula maiorica SM1]|uniref:Sulfatase family protein n=1 Tax=Rhodopirellula maiorica SM1 TaxID=1265738 RepID=M5RIE1_9BACT|nr:sulfatase family protein [Rhodopirellula maiorica SM1]
MLIGTVLLCNVSIAKDSPNVLIIQTDEHNFRTLGAYRETLPPDQAFVWGDDAVVQTPSIDSIANRGVICTSFYATSPVCTPSRAAFFSGVPPHKTGAHSNDQPYRNDIVTFAEVLRRDGYSTGYAGKWHLDGPGKPQWAPKRQFGFADNRFMFNRGHWKNLEIADSGPRVGSRNQKDAPNYNVGDANEQTYATDWLADRAVDFIREHANEPFCYHLSIPDPHGPNTVRAPYDTMFADMAIRPPLSFSMSRENPAWAAATGRNASLKFNPSLMQHYFGMVRCIDDNVGKILNTLDELQLTDRTVIVFTSDHGDLCYEHGRLNKGNPYEGSAKIPMLIAAPGIIPPATRVDQAFGTVDFAPTLLALLGKQAPESVEGRDASGVLTGKTQSDLDEVAILQSSGLKPSWFAVINDRFKLVFSVSEQPWLFDLEKDPHELKNSIDVTDNQKVVRSMAAALRDYVAKQDVNFVHSKIDQQLRDLLGDDAAADDAATDDAAADDTTDGQ